MCELGHLQVSEDWLVELLTWEQGTYSEVSCAPRMHALKAYQIATGPSSACLMQTMWFI